MKRVGLVTDRKKKDLSGSDQLLIEPLKKAGFIAEAVVWDDPRVDWQKYAVLILRSCWDYPLKYGKWLAWLDGLKALKTKVWNPLETVGWSLNKKYLIELQTKGVRIVPTLLVQQGGEAQIPWVLPAMGWEDWVMKPAVGNEAIKVKRFKHSLLEKGVIYGGTILKTGDLLIQKYMPQITQGEYSLIFINKKYSHGVLKLPKAGDFRSNYKFGGEPKLITVPKEIIEQGQQVVDAVEKPLLYARVDGVMDGPIFRLMELELIEPHLFFDLYPSGADEMARALYELN